MTMDAVVLVRMAQRIGGLWVRQNKLIIVYLQQLDNVNVFADNDNFRFLSGFTFVIVELDAQI